jgi:hypothetical protein
MLEYSGCFRIWRRPVSVWSNAEKVGKGHAIYKINIGTSRASLDVVLANNML